MLYDRKARLKNYYFQPKPQASQNKFVAAQENKYYVNNISYF